MGYKTRFDKPTGVRYVDMCIYIDNTFYTPERDETTCFQYMYLLAFMLANKARYFNRYDDYDLYSCYLAQSTYMRMADTSKAPIKSVLNYMRSIMYFRKVAFLRETFSEVIDAEYNPEWNIDLFQEKELRRLEAKNYHLLHEIVFDLIRNITSSIKNNIPKVYKEDKKLYDNLYKSVLLSLISQITMLPNREEIFIEKQDCLNFIDCEYIHKNICSDIICWRIPEELSSLVSVIINKTKDEFARDIYETMDEFRIDISDLNKLNLNLIDSLGENDGQ